MDPRNENLKKHGHYSTGQVVGMYFRVGSNGQVATQGPCVIDVTRQGHYLNGRATGFEFAMLENHDEATGLIYQAGRRPFDGLLTFGMVEHGETAQAALDRLVPTPLPDVRALWKEMQDRQRAHGAGIEAAIRGGLTSNLQALGADPDAEILTDDEPGQRRP